MYVHLVDGTFELFRAYYGSPPSADARGSEVGAARGLARSLLALLGERDVTHVAIAFDHVIESFRNDLYPGYKTGEGIDPALYGQAPAGAHVRSMDAAADMFECELMRRALDAGRPLLTICRGMQLLNVVLGGTLVQDLGEGIHVRDDVPMISHPVHVHPGTRLAGIVGAGAHDIRSGHHQAVDRLGAGLAVSATAPDGVIEAVELPGAWVVGVQWHPEDAGADPAPFRSLLADFARAAADAPRSGPAPPAPAQPRA